MGTRHLVAVQVDGEYKIAQYGQWDGYPEGQGATVLAFLRNADLDQFREKCRATRWITHEELEDRWGDVGAKRGGPVTLDIADRFRELYPELSRDTGAKVLRIVHDQPPGVKLKNDIDFAKDSLFCEFAYVIDLDANTFEAYRGFNKQPVEKGRFTGPVEDGYGPVTLFGVWPLDALPKNQELLDAYNLAAGEVEPEELRNVH